MAVDRRAANLKTLNKADKIQDKTEEAIFRIQRQAAEAEGLGTQTLEELRRQGQQMNDINNNIDDVSSQLEQSAALQSQFDRWAGNWFGGKKNAAMKEATTEILLRQQEEHMRVKEVFQHQKYDNLKRKWRKAGLVLCTNTGVAVDDLFDPKIQITLPNSRWVIDFSLTGIDDEGWTYAPDFATLDKQGAGDRTPKWNSYARRRKWRYNDGSNGIGGGATVDAVRQRQTERAANSRQAQVDNIGNVPRNQAIMTASGLTSTAGRRPRPDQALDEESAEGLARLKAREEKIDSGLDTIGNQLDTLGNIARTMNEEAVSQNAKLDKMDKKMAITSEKLAVVNARQRYLLK